jgi:hypothetical protein
LMPLGSDPTSQLGVITISLRNIAVPVVFAIVSKLAETIFPDDDAAFATFPFETQAF